MYWLASDAGKLKKYVSNRVITFQKEGLAVKHVPIQLNPADFVSKITPPSLYVNQPMWLKGPDFLKTSSYFPVQPTLTSSKEEKKIIFEEIRKITPLEKEEIFSLENGENFPLVSQITNNATYKDFFVTT